MNSTEAIREIAEKHFPCVGTRNDREYRKMEQDALVSDLTALISEHYVAKEEVDKMVSERLREELGLYNDWLNGAAGKYLTSPYIDEYLTSEYYLKSREK